MTDDFFYQEAVPTEELVCNKAEALADILDDITKTHNETTEMLRIIIEALNGEQQEHPVEKPNDTHRMSILDTVRRERESATTILNYALRIKERLW